MSAIALTLSFRKPARSLPTPEPTTAVMITATRRRTPVLGGGLPAVLLGALHGGGEEGVRGDAGVAVGVLRGGGDVGHVSPLANRLTTTAINLRSPLLPGQSLRTHLGGGSEVPISRGTFWVPDPALQRSRTPSHSAIASAREWTPIFS